jgi:type IV fimbrial biogenesis protein FimT
MNITNKQTGFTLIELMMVLVVVAILLAIGIPSFRELIMNNRITTATNDFASALSVARIEAVKRGTGMVVVATSGGGSSNEWGVGYTVSVWNDDNDDEVVDSGEIAGTPFRTFQALNSDITFDASGGTTQISFLSTGVYNSAATQTFTLCDSRTGETGRQFTLALTGVFNLDRGFACP